MSLKDPFWFAAATRRHKLWQGENSNAIDLLTYDWEYRCADCEAASWPARNGNGPDLTRSVGVAPTLGVSTSGLLSSGLPADLVDNAVQFASGSNGFVSASGVAFPATDRFHIRVLYYDDGSIGAGSRFTRYLAAGTNYAEIYQNGATSVATRVANPTATSSIENIASIQPGWMLADYQYDRNKGGGGVGLFELFINGVDFGQNLSAVSQLADGNGTLGVAGTTSGGNTPAVELVFLGWRFDHAELSLADNQEASTLLGLYSP